jgi:glyoxylase-like metal-dependent hydrolase (beta-lactamase superfamily II)
MVVVPFVTDPDVSYGTVVEVAPDVRRVVANNPSKFTYTGTGTHLIGRGDVIVIDPGPDDRDHVAALLAATEGERITHQLITHTHGDHSPAARALGEATGAPTVAFGPHPPEAVTTDPDDDTPTEEHADVEFVPDIVVGHGDLLDLAGHAIEAVHTPGHISNHLCFALVERGMLFTGDHVMGWSTTIIPPPDGDMTAYLASLELVLARPETVLVPTHGPLITEPRAFVGALIEHRLARERAIVDQLALGPRTVAEIVAVLYADVDEALHKPAARSVTAHLERLATLGRAAATSDPDPTWHLDP